MDNNKNQLQPIQQPLVQQVPNPVVPQQAQSVPSAPTSPVVPQSQQVATQSVIPAAPVQPLQTSGDPSPVPPQTSPVASDQPMQTLIDQVERDLLAHIYTNLKENKISGIAAQELAKEFLSLLPFKDKKDLVDKLSTLGQKYPEARQTYVNLGIPIEEQQRQERLDQMREHIKAGDLDKALEIAKGGAQNGSTVT